MKVRLATKADLPSLYRLGLQTPEIQVSSTEPFMDEDEFLTSLDKPENFFLMADADGQMAGFLMGISRDLENRGLQNRYACIAYIVIAPSFRGRGFAKELYLKAEEIFREKGMTHVYCWANLDSGIIPFLQKEGFTKGHQYVWMDKKL